MDVARDLLKKFGLDLFGFDPGVSAYFAEDTPTPPNVVGLAGRGYWGEPIHFSKLEWQWLKPLLEELAEARHAFANSKDPIDRHWVKGDREDFCHLCQCHKDECEK